MRTDGFTMVEMLIATVITVAVVGAILAVITPAQTMVRSQGDAADLHQRLRAGADTMGADVRAAMAVARIGLVRRVTMQPLASTTDPAR